MKDEIIRGADGRIKNIIHTPYRGAKRCVLYKSSGFGRFNKSVYDKYCDFEPYFEELKNGEYRIRYEQLYVTPLDICGRCGKLIKPDWRNHRHYKVNGFYSKKERELLIIKDLSNIYFNDPKYWVLCRDCHKKVKKVADMALTYFENRKLINQITREITNERKKNSNNRQP